jgi:hypothetical protein
MAYERALSNVEYDRVSLSYDKNSLSGIIFYKCKCISYFQPVKLVLTGLKNLIS